VAFQRGRVIGAIEKPDKRSTRYRLFHPGSQAFDFADEKSIRETYQRSSQDTHDSSFSRKSTPPTLVPSTFIFAKIGRRLFIRVANFSKPSTLLEVS
jgi:hypothetical protein